MIYYLYIKTHNKTGLKYLGQTIQNPYKYRGSGKLWKKHIKENGNDVSTRIIGEYNNAKDLKNDGRFWSIQLDIVNSNEWANSKLEEGNGGNWSFTDEQKRRMSESHKGIPSPLKGKRHSENAKRKMSFAKKGKTYEEIYGKEQGKFLKETRNKHLRKYDSLHLRDHRGNKNPMYGQRHSELERKKISNATKEAMNRPEVRARYLEGIKRRTEKYYYDTQ